MLVRGWWHLHCDDRTAFDPTSLVKLVGMRTSKLGRDFRLANIRITVQEQARQALRPSASSRTEDDWFMAAQRVSAVASLRGEH
jgi:hypothetical protein